MSLQAVSDLRVVPVAELALPESDSGTADGRDLLDVLVNRVMRSRVRIHREARSAHLGRITESPLPFGVKRRSSDGNKAAHAR
jgi:hypothetical protein